METHSPIILVWIHHESYPERRLLTYAALDEQSDACFATDSTFALDVQGIDAEVKISTIVGDSVVRARKATGLIISGYFDHTMVPIPSLYSHKCIPVRRNQIPRPQTLLE